MLKLVRDGKIVLEHDLGKETLDKKQDDTDQDRTEGGDSK